MVELKTNITNSYAQSQFLPIIQRAETEIKKLVLYYATHLKSKMELRQRIEGIVKSVNNKVPMYVIERTAYITGLFKFSEKIIKEVYDPIITRYHLALAMLLFLGFKERPSSPLEMAKFYQRNSGLIEDRHKYADGFNSHLIIPKADMWGEAKGTTYIPNYGRELHEIVQELAETPATTSQPGKKPISDWQKAEIDLRADAQKKRLEELHKKGVRYAWTSTHPDCSKRCEPWQGKLFDLDAEHSELPNFKMKLKLEHHNVYCFKEVEAQVDKYGYKNNIINGFNCRHRLIPYERGVLPPKEYDAKDIEEQRKINAQLREYEREIRLLLQKALLYNKIDKKLSLIYKRKARDLIAEYKEFARQNGYAWYDYRIKI